MLTREDIWIAAQTLYGEARGEPYYGKKAVAHVFINRTNKKIGDRDHSLAATSLRQYQFSTWLENDPNRKLIENAQITDKLFRDCIRAILESLDEDDFTKGATHYHTDKIAPPWSVGKHPCLTVGSHLFYNNI